ncbi:transcription factor subunit Med10 of mediator complex protein [Gregarina niphandrodes]|uniref:Mediator of RNA polymerase II transcription subunit 10 n=1 Tax=Gregarina niphandrodes TaxID=110365 RepID=A0A023B8T3_GRENI|nr:transcription factor subunit Med10 of mediator complex protein [Gregarina niphandrodes]EZG70288.1 transcription factor subunit Med10 of mediator complex protein [Gregarina niphandrodes]|eukprot:XP_011129950.1 transcription factor subunit Med10 of mediator complex protein [Gregarina niphandrodes]
MNDGVNDEHEEAMESGGGGVEMVVKQLIEAVGDLSVVARTLERWPIYAPPLGVSQERQDSERQKFERAEIKGRQRIAEHLRRFMRKSRRVCEIVSPTFDLTNLPQDLINHVDAYLSPNLWLRGLVTEVQYANDITRGELVALGSMHSTLTFYLNVVKQLNATEGSTVTVPDFSLPFLPPTVLRPPVVYDANTNNISIPHILKMLIKPITPYDLRQDPKEPNQVLFPPEITGNDQDEGPGGDGAVNEETAMLNNHEADDEDGGTPAADDEDRARAANDGQPRGQPATGNPVDQARSTAPGDGEGLLSAASGKASTSQREKRELEDVSETSAGSKIRRVI